MCCLSAPDSPRTAFLPAAAAALQDFFFKSPAVPSDGLRVVLTPKSKGVTPGAAGHEAAPASAARSVPRTAGRSRLSQVDRKSVV